MMACHDQVPESKAALTKLCEIYWYPLYSHVRRRGYEPEGAKDLTQGFFLHLIEHEALTHADAQKGKFRSFLLASLNNFLSAAYRHEQALKRGGGRESFSLDVEDAEARYQIQPAEQLSAEDIFDARWALSLLDESMQQLKKRYDAKPHLFETLKQYISPSGQTAPYEETARSLGITVPAVKTLIHRMRQQFGAILREEVTRTVTDTEEVEGEIRYLCDLLVRTSGRI